MTARIAAVVRLRRSPWALRLLLFVLVIALAIAFNSRTGSAEASRKYDVPHSPTIESKIGIRFVQAAVVADGGLVELRYTVLDVDKATTFQNDVQHPPVLKSAKRSNHPLYRTALMKQGHNLRAGQTYYILYLNNHGAVRSGESLEIDAAGAALLNVPVR
jgi:hypothetical protein